MGCNIARLQRILFHPSYPSVGGECFVMPWVRTLHHTAGYFANQSIGSQRNAAPFGIPIALLIDPVTTERAPPMDGMIREARNPNSTILSPSRSHPCSPWSNGSNDGGTASHLFPRQKRFLAVSSGVLPMKILFVTPEVEPFVKVGGLADMVGALPKDLAAAGHDVRVVCPLYGSVKRIGSWTPHVQPLGIDVGDAAVWARTWETHLPGTTVPVYFLENDHYYGRGGVYGDAEGAYSDNDLRFIILARASLTLCLQMDWIPDVVHAHDWTTGFVPVMLNTVLRNSALKDTASVFTVHNLEYQGHAHRRALKFSHVPESEFHPESLEALGAVNPLKAGLYHATKITTVSPTYAREIRTPEGGFGLDPVLRFRGADLIGILNGIDDVSWNPATDKALPANFSMDSLAGKAVCKTALQTRLELDAGSRAPLYGVVARLASQKGLDLLADALPKVMSEMDVQVALLGSGDNALETAFRTLALRYPGRIGVHIGFDGSLARLIQAGADFFVMPSRAEPCGLTQMYAMRYGAPPIVRSTGGLIDTVENYNEKTGAGTGFRFDAANASALANTMGWACSTYYDRPAHYAALQRTGMSRDFSWKQSASRYIDVYRWAVQQRTGRPLDSIH